MELKETKNVETVQAEYLAPDLGDHKQPEEAVVVRMLRPGALGPSVLFLFYISIRVQQSP